MASSVLKLKTGFKPKKFLETKSAVNEADMAEIRTSGEKCLWTSSNENKTPAKGALKAAARPALAPLEIKYFSSVFESLVSWLKY